jgi:PLP dependent protein
MKTVIEANYQAVCERIAKAAVKAGRAPESVRLVVVTKGHSVDAVQQVVAAGARCLGENYVGEALGKIQALSGHGVEWRMIGHLQSRKAREVAFNFHSCDSIDGWKLAERLDRFAGEAGRRLPVLIECNVSGEASKSGFAAWVEADWAELARQLEQILTLTNLKVHGLMTVPPFFDEPERVRPFFQRLRRLQAFLSERLPEGNWGDLSMGMSGDFEAAIEEGATLVRVGTAIMGARNY